MTGFNCSHQCVIAILLYMYIWCLMCDVWGQTLVWVKEYMVLYISLVLTWKWDICEDECETMLFVIRVSGNGAKSQEMCQCNWTKLCVKFIYRWQATRQVFTRCYSKVFISLDLKRCAAVWLKLSGCTFLYLLFICYIYKTIFFRQLDVEQVTWSFCSSQGRIDYYIRVHHSCHIYSGFLKSAKNV